MTSETIFATEAEMADWASAFSAAVEVELMVAAVDSVRMKSVDGTREED